MRSVAKIFSSYEELDAQGRHVNGTDKNGPCHSYGDAYEQILADANIARAGVTLMMEVGVADGSSLLAWAEVFPHARVVGMDIHQCSRSRESDRVEFHLGDATVADNCRMVAAGRQFDLIVDDASHQLGDILATMFHLFPYVRPGGLYVVEEFQGLGGARASVEAMFPYARVYDTPGPFGGNEPLFVASRVLGGRSLTSSKKVRLG